MRFREYPLFIAHRHNFHVRANYRINKAAVVELAAVARFVVRRVTIQKILLYLNLQLPQQSMCGTGAPLEKGGQEDVGNAEEERRVQRVRGGNVTKSQ
jgi:hypothetical protein